MKLLAERPDEALDEQQPEYVIGLDIDDRGSSVCLLNPTTRDVIDERRINTTEEGVTNYLEEFDESCRVAIRPRSFTITQNN